MPDQTHRSIFREDLFAGRTCLITGGGTGIGRCIARELARLGATTVLLGRREHVLADTAAEIVAGGGSASWVSANIRDAEAVAAAVKTVCERHGKIDALVNNAGGQFRVGADSISPNGWRSVIDLNLTGTFLVSSAVHAASMAEHGGAIVSIVAPVERGAPLFAHSGAARAGVVNLTKTLAAEWAASGVRVNAVASGVIASAGLDGYPADQLAVLAKQIGLGPLLRLGTESEIASAVAFLLSPAAGFITGQTVAVDGGVDLARAGGTGAAVPKGALVAFEGFAGGRDTTPDWLGPASEA